MDAIDMDIPSDIESEFLQSGNTIANGKEGLEAKLQANSEDIKKLSSSLTNMQNMLLTLLNKDQAKSTEVRDDPENDCGLQTCYDPSQNFELISNPTANSPTHENQGDFDICLVKTYLTALKPKVQKYLQFWQIERPRL